MLQGKKITSNILKQFSVFVKTGKNTPTVDETDSLKQKKVAVHKLIQKGIPGIMFGVYILLSQVHRLATCFYFIFYSMWKHLHFFHCYFWQQSSFPAQFAHLYWS